METVLFVLFGSVAVGASIMVVTRKHPLSSAIHLILAMAAVAALFVLRQAHFLAAVQLIVYAGAVVVLFVFVIMLTNVPADRLPAERATLFRIAAAGAAGLLVVEAAAAAGRFAMPAGPDGGGGTLEAVGRALFTDFLLAFEIVSVLLLAALIGAIAVAKRKI